MRIAVMISMIKIQINIGMGINNYGIIITCETYTNFRIDTKNSVVIAVD